MLLQLSEKLLEDLFSYETGLLTEEQAIQLFQELIDKSLTVKIGLDYEITAKSLIVAGLCTPKEAA